MADLENLPNVDQSSAAFIAEFAQMIVEKANANGNYGAADVRTRAVAQWGDFVDGVLVALQARVQSLQSEVDDLSDQVDSIGGGTVVADIDFSAEPSSGAISDGTVAIDGVNWTAENVAAAGTFAIVNGTGLRYVSTTTSTEYHNTSRTATNIAVPASTLISDFDPAGVYLIEAYFTALTFVSSGNRVLVGMLNAPPSLTTRFACCGFGNDGNDRSARVQVDTSSTATERLTHDCAICRLSPTGIAAYSGVYDNGFPAPSDRASCGVGMFATTTVNGRAVMDPDALIVIAFRTGATTEGMTIDLNRLRITRTG